MTFDKDPRIRISAKQSAKNIWQFDATVEYHEESVKVENIIDSADITEVTLGDKLLQHIKSAEKAFKEDGRKLVSDSI